MVTARAIYSGFDLMLSANKELTRDIIDVLSRNGYSGVYIYDEYSNIEVLRELIDEDLRTRSLKALEELDTDKVLFLANDIVDDLMGKEGDLAIDMNQLSIYDQTTYEHSLNVALTATACGIGMGLSNERLVRLTCGALLHDCGKAVVPKEILNKPAKLTDEEMYIMRRHTQYGFDLLYNRNEIHPESRAVALCHHENWDGTGYPRQLEGENIPLLSRIVHVADVYDALAKKRAYKERYSQSECIEYLMGGCDSLFDYNIVKVFLKYICVYPVGCDVRLSDGRVARVIENTPGYIERPKVVVGNDILDLANDLECMKITILGEVQDEEDDDEL